MKEAKDLTIEDISQLKKEISHFYHLRALFAGLGWAAHDNMFNQGRNR